MFFFKCVQIALKYKKKTNPDQNYYAKYSINCHTIKLFKIVPWYLGYPIISNINSQHIDLNRLTPNVNE